MSACMRFWATLMTPQTGVKRIFSDEAIRAQLLERGYFSLRPTRSTGAACCRRWSTMCLFVATLSGMESSKKGRRSISVFPQAILVIFCQHTMPSAWGAPIGRLICASNRNDVLTEFLRTGMYDRNRPFYTTMSPSMDILISSNLERLLYALSDGNDAEVRSYMKTAER